MFTAVPRGAFSSSSSSSFSCCSAYFTSSFSVSAAVVGNAELGRHAEHSQIPLTQKAAAATATEGTETFAEAGEGGKRGGERKRGREGERQKGVLNNT